MNADPN